MREPVLLTPVPTLGCLLSLVPTTLMPALTVFMPAAYQAAANLLCLLVLNSPFTGVCLTDMAWVCHRISESISNAAWSPPAAELRPILGPAPKTSSTRVHSLALISWQQIHLGTVQYISTIVDLCSSTGCNCDVYSVPAVPILSSSLLPLSYRVANESDWHHWG